MPKQLFAVYLGGTADRANTELHDVVFVVGNRIEDTYGDLMDKWFGNVRGLHLDSWIALDIVDGYTISLVAEKPSHAEKLYFVNLGAYADGQFTEIHANTFLVANSAAEAKTMAKKRLLAGWPGPVHKDDLHDVDDCLEVSSIRQDFVRLEKTNASSTATPQNGYHIIPKPIVAAYVAAKERSGHQRS